MKRGGLLVPDSMGGTTQCTDMRPELSVHLHLLARQWLLGLKATGYPWHITSSTHCTELGSKSGNIFTLPVRMILGYPAILSPRQSKRPLGAEFDMCYRFGSIQQYLQNSTAPIGRRHWVTNKRVEIWDVICFALLLDT